MRSELFSEQMRETQHRGMALQNPRMLRVGLDGEVYARQGSMVAYQGDIDFAYKGAGSITKLLKKSLSGEGVPLMTVSGRGDVFFARDAWEIHVIDLEGDSITVNGENVLAFEPGLEWDIRRVEGAGLISGGLFNTVFTGTGRIAVACHGTPVLLNVDQPTFVDPQAAVAWAASLRTGMRRTVKAGALIGRGSGEAFQLAFEGQGFVLVQASEGVPPAQATA
ncbi:AIM24 family protein [Streptomonospora sp. S1-112]|uniref:AIM24 family protein n=1 Tax=Streptomonospora mangrovi TaxID=2883123 RepID=A0A9X3NNN5_9ACTN|nr:AIM24 family protein [Streptomonospora mangrovi]MDA0566633.1 AIM24 family protein [Streptomonospora mangrovi]